MKELNLFENNTLHLILTYKSKVYTKKVYFRRMNQEQRKAAVRLLAEGTIKTMELVDNETDE